MTDFTFTQTTDQQNSVTTMDDSPIDDLSEDTDSELSYIDGTPSVHICSSTSTYLNVMDDLRRQTGTGMPEKDRGYSPDQSDAVADSSMAGEAGLHLLYDEWEFDDEIYENGGDGGIDGELEIGGELLSCDVKCVTSQYDDVPWLKVLVSKRHTADVFILASFDGGEVTYHGWIAADDLLVDERKSRRTGKHNYLVTDSDELNEMPEPTTERSVGTSRFTFSG